MRVISGIARGRRLKSGSGRTTRPTPDRVRQILFDILGPRALEATFLDLYAGFGTVGIEALSRGAGRAVFVERSRKCCRTINENLRLTGFQEQGEVICGEVLRILPRWSQSERVFSVIFADPPYQTEQVEKCLAALAESPGLLAREGWIIVQHHVREQPSPARSGLVRWRTRRVGDTQLSFYKRPEQLQVEPSRKLRCEETGRAGRGKQEER